MFGTGWFDIATGAMGLFAALVGLAGATIGLSVARRSRGGRDSGTGEPLGETPSPPAPAEARLQTYDLVDLHEVTRADLPTRRAQPFYERNPARAVLVIVLIATGLVVTVLLVNFGTDHATPYAIPQAIRSPCDAVDVKPLDPAQVYVAVEIHSQIEGPNGPREKGFCELIIEGEPGAADLTVRFDVSHFGTAEAAELELNDAFTRARESGRVVPVGRLGPGAFSDGASISARSGTYVFDLSIQGDPGMDLDTAIDVAATTRRRLTE